MKKILITGASGFIGKNIVQYLSNKKTDFILLTPPHEQLDLCDQENVHKYLCVNEIDIVIHCAICGSKSKQDNGIQKCFNDIEFIKIFKIL